MIRLNYTNYFILFFVRILGLNVSFKLKQNDLTKPKIIPKTFRQMLDFNLLKNKIIQYFFFLHSFKSFMLFLYFVMSLA